MGLTHTENSNAARRAIDVDVQIAASRAVRKWLNASPDKPCHIGMEYLPDDYGCCITVTETPYKVRSFIYGGYVAVYEFDIVYRCMPVTDDERLAADEALDALAVWAANHMDTLSIPNARVRRVERTTPATLSARYSNGAEDHTVHAIIEFEVK